MIIKVHTLLISAVCVALCISKSDAASPTPAEVKAIAKEADLYRLLLVDRYRIQYAYHAG